MDSIVYYNVSSLPNLDKFMDGDTIFLQDLINARKKINPDLFKNSGFLENINEINLDPLGVEKPTKWEMAVATVIFSLSGQIPDRQEVLRGRQIINALPNWFKKKYVNRNFVLSFIPYILIIMKSHIGDDFQSDSNKINDIVKNIISLFESRKPKLVSFLCSHRAPSVPIKNVLIDKIPLNQARKCLNAQLAIIANKTNSNEINGGIVWHQQAGTYLSAMSLFPEMFIYYLEKGMISEMIEILNSHYIELKQEFSVLGKIEIEIKDTDYFTRKVIRFLEESFGKNWKQTNFLNHENDSKFLEIALKLALPEVKRFIIPKDKQFASKLLGNKSFHINNNIRYLEKSKINIVTKTINLFFDNLLMTESAKAVYEVAFYYLWGQMSFEDKTIPVGIDRDHEKYQYEAWNLGYSSQTSTLHDSPTSLIYLRRTNKEEIGKTLSRLSFRQSWK